MAKQNKVIILAVLLAIICLIVLIVNLNFSESRKIYSEVVVGSNPGFDLNTTALTFGRVQPGFDSERSVFVNSSSSRVKVSIEASGKIKNYISVSENNFILEKGQNKTLLFDVHMPRDADEGKISGFIIIKSRRILFGR